MRNSYLFKIIIRQTTLPVIGCCLLITFTFSILNRQQLVSENQKTESLVRSLASTKQDLNFVPGTSEYQFAYGMLQGGKVHALGVYEQQQNRVSTELGLPLSIDNIEETISSGGRAKFDSYIYLTIKKDREAANHHGEVIGGEKWVVASYDASRYVISNYQGMLILLLVGSVACILAFLNSRKFYLTLTAPLESIHKGIRNYSRGNYDTLIPASKSDVYYSLVNEINRLAMLQKNAQSNFDTNIEQTTHELRETLETVEIQNIELDLERKNAIKASRIKSEFLANISHEIRTPLNGIIGFSQLLEKTELNAQQSEYITTVSDSAKGLLTIISDILDFSRLETGQLALEHKHVNIRQIIEETMKTLAPAAYEKNLRLLTIVDHEIPEDLLGDPLRLRQVLSNLVSNAIKFTDSGYVLVKLVIESRETQNLTMKFNVVDSGKGLHPEQQENLFNSFTQIDGGDNRPHGGIGLGLAIAKGLVDRMNGRIGVESQFGSGANFWFSLKLDINPQQITENSLSHTLSNVNALIYDTNTIGRDEISHYLKGWGVENIVEVTNCIEVEEKARKLAKECRNTIAILDVTIENQAFDEAKIKQVVNFLIEELHTPTIFLATPSIQRLLAPLIDRPNIIGIHRPLSAAKLHQVISDMLGASSTSEIVSKLDIKKTKSINPKTRILAVDDNPANLRLVCELLKDLDIEVETADTGKGAIDMHTKNNFDLILMDIQMPGMSGMDTTKLIREAETHIRIPIVALTAQTGTEIKTKLLLAGMDDYLTKPVNEHDLKLVIERWTYSIKKSLSDKTAASNKLSAPAIPSNVLDEQDESEKQMVVSISQCLKLAKNKPDLARDMLVMLVNSLDSQISEVEESYKAKNFEQLQECVHRLHGSCCYTGVPGLKQASSTLDILLTRGETGDLDELVKSLLIRLNELRCWAAEHDIDIIFDINTEDN